jgi:hypothetical protein
VRPGPVELVLVARGDDDLVDERVAESRDLDPPAPRAPIRVEVGVRDLDPLALRGRPHADHGVARVRAGDAPAVLGDLGLRHLEDDRVRRESGQVVLALTLVARRRTQVRRVEDRTEVDEERIVALAGEHLAAAPQVLDRSTGHRAVVGERLRTRVRRRDGQVVRNPPRLRPAVRPVGLTDDVVGLGLVELRIVDRSDARERLQVRVRVDLRVEDEPVGHVLPAVAGVVDVDVVAGAIVEPEEIRPVRRHLAGYPVRHDGQGIRCVLRREGVDVGVVRRRVE